LNYHLFKLIPPRTTFPGDITPAEAALMQAHAAYWDRQMGLGHVLAIGPVMDPAGAYGIGILQVEDGVDPAALIGQDPVLLADAGFRWEVHPLPRLMVQGRGAIPPAR
jgi:uncharacterized protein YciI